MQRLSGRFLGLPGGGAVLDCFRFIRMRYRILRFGFAKRIILGAGGMSYAGWLATDQWTLDVIEQREFERFWRPNTREAFLAEHVWEHLTAPQRKRANENCFEFLKPGGRLRIAVPDGLNPDQSYIEQVRPGGKGSGAADHTVLFDHRSLGDELQAAGFHVQTLEYWDESGIFRFENWSSTDGHILRSRRHDPRNQNGVLRYTSLIVDAIKPIGRTSSEC